MTSNRTPARRGHEDWTVVTRISAGCRVSKNQGAEGLFIFSPVAPTLVPQPLTNFLKPGSYLIALPWRSELHAIADLVEALAHPLAMLAPSLPFLTVAGAALPTWPLNFDDLAVDTGFHFQRAGLGRGQQRAHRQKAGSKNGHQARHDAPLSIPHTARTVERATHSRGRRGMQEVVAAVTPWPRSWSNAIARFARASNIPPLRGGQCRVHDHDLAQEFRGHRYLVEAAKETRRIPPPIRNLPKVARLAFASFSSVEVLERNDQDRSLGRIGEL